MEPPPVAEATTAISHISLGVMRVICSFTIAIAVVSLRGADLDSIPRTQEKLFALRGQNPQVRGANPELTVLKHQIRDWVDSRITNLGEKADLAQATAQLNMDLSAVKLTKPDTSSDFIDLRLGEVDDVKLEHPKGDESWLTFTSAVGIDGCGWDNSVYLYEWSDGRWTRRFELERDDYSDKYRPIEIVGSVEVSSQDANRERLVLVLGNSWGCASNWQDFYYSLSRIGGNAKTLLNGSQIFFLGDEDSYQGRIEPSGVLIEYLGNGKDTEIRRHVLHYKVEGDTVKRVEPIALTARDFVDEWLSLKWDEIAQWSDPHLRDQHNKLSAEEVADGWLLVQKCSDNTSHWEVAVDFEDEMKYFLVEQRGDYSFRMLDITDEQLAGCPGDDRPDAGKPTPTLFPKKTP